MTKRQHRSSHARYGDTLHSRFWQPVAVKGMWNIFQETLLYEYLSSLRVKTATTDQTQIATKINFDGLHGSMDHTWLRDT